MSPSYSLFLTVTDEKEIRSASYGHGKLHGHASLEVPCGWFKALLLPS